MKNNNYKISFQEMARLGQENLDKQPPVTLEEAKKALEELRKQISTGDRKKNNNGRADAIR